MGTLFKGRDEFLAQLRASLARTGRRSGDGHRRKALHGLGGVGKTHAWPSSYAWRHHDDYSALLFIPAQTPSDLRRHLAALTGPLVL